MTIEAILNTYDRYSEEEIEKFREQYKTPNWSGQEDFNAIAHALTTAGLVYNHGLENGNGAGEFRELRSILFDEKNSVRDSLKCTETVLT